MTAEDEERFQRIESTLDRLTQREAYMDNTMANLAAVVNALASSVAALNEASARHDRQLEVLIEITRDNTRTCERIEHQWEAYVNTLRKQ